MEKLKEDGVGCSVHWRPLHLHPYYQETFGWPPDDFPVATSLWESLISLPIFPRMMEDEVMYVIQTIKRICASHLR
jgi:perosamine synthetase